MKLGLMSLGQVSSGVLRLNWVTEPKPAQDNLVAQSNMVTLPCSPREMNSLIQFKGRQE